MRGVKASRLLLFGVLGCSVLGFLTSSRAEPDSAEPARQTQRHARIWADSRTAWIYEKPRLSRNGVGYLRAGGSAALTTGEPVKGPGCAGGWYAVEPAGYICDDQRTEFRPNRYVQSMQQAQPGKGPLPYHYALSNYAPMYRRLPTRQEWEKEERYLGEPGTFGPLSWGNRGHERLAEVRVVAPSDPVPSFFADGGSVSRRHVDRALRRLIPLGSMLAYTKSFEHLGRTWLLSADGTLVPADRVRPFRPSKFVGLRLRGEQELPLAWLKGEPKPRYVRSAEGGFEDAGRWPARSHISLERVQPVVDRNHRYWQSQVKTADGRPLFVREEDASVLEPRDELPWGIGADEKWLTISITRGVLVAYRGKRPVYTTLVSPGAGGVPVKGHDPVKWSTTPIGRFRITFKHWVADMSPEKGEDRKFWIADVPYTQYFSPPFAIHVAYWHENFGEPMSAGCINVSPRDGKWLFDWTDPKLPTGWNGVAPSAFSGKGTVLIVTR